MGGYSRYGNQIGLNNLKFISINMGMGRTNHKRNPAQDNLELRREETRSGLEAALRKVGTVAGFAGILMARPSGQIHKT